MKMLITLVTAAVLVAVPLVAGAESTAVDLKAADGTALKATYHSPGRPGPAMLLLHQCNRDRHSWDQLAADLVRAGMETVAGSKNTRSTVKIYSGTEHGLPMFEKNPDLEPAIVSWVKTVLQ